MSNSYNLAVDLSGVLTAIDAKEIRGTWDKVFRMNPGAAYVEMLNITGSGKLIALTAKTNGTGTGDIKLKLDGKQGMALHININENLYLNYELSAVAQPDLVGSANINLINSEFINECLIEVRHQANNMEFHAIYSED